MTACTSDTPGCLLKEPNLDRARYLGLLDRAAELKASRAAGERPRRLVGRNIALIFEKSSTCTRCAFEVAAHDEGAEVTYLGPDGSHIGRDESIADTAQVLGRMYDGIEFRGFAQKTVEQLADNSGVPVWNGLTDRWHPTQAMADVMTMRERHGVPLEEIAYCFYGDGRNNVARSLFITPARCSAWTFASQRRRSCTRRRRFWPPRTGPPRTAAPGSASPTRSARRCPAQTSSTPTCG